MYIDITNIFIVCFLYKIFLQYWAKKVFKHVLHQGVQNFWNCPIKKEFDSQIVRQNSQNFTTFYDILLKWVKYQKYVYSPYNHWTVGHSAVQPLDSLTEHYLTFGKLDRALSDNWTVGQSTVRPLHWTVQHAADQPSNSLTQHWLTIGLLDTALSNHCTVWQSIIQPLDS